MNLTMEPSSSTFARVSKCLKQATVRTRNKQERISAQKGLTYLATAMASSANVLSGRTVSPCALMYLRSVCACEASRASDTRTVQNQLKSAEQATPAAPKYFAPSID